MYICLSDILPSVPPRPTILSRSLWQAELQAREDAPLSLLRVNVDAFASVPRPGQAALLQGLERLLAMRLPSDSLLGRLGLDEYGVQLPETSPETALRLADDLVRAFVRHRDPLWPRTVGLSVGVAARPAHAADAAGLMLAADEALLRAKHEGRGRAALYLPAKMVLKSNYYPRSQLEHLKAQAAREGRPEADLLRTALAAYLESQTP